MSKIKRKKRREQRKQQRKQRRAARKAKRAAKGGGIVKRTTKKLIGRAKDKLKNLGQNSKYALLLPFKGLMFAALKAKGVKTPNNDISTISRAFFQVIIKKQPYVASNYEEENIDPVTISMIVKTVINFIKGLKKKKEEGEVLTGEEETILNDAEKIAEEVEDAGNALQSRTTSDGGFDIGQFMKDYGVIIFAVVIAGFFILKGKK